NGKQPTVFSVENGIGELPNDEHPDAVKNDINVSHNGKQPTVFSVENGIGELPNDEHPDAVKNDINVSHNGKQPTVFNVENYTAEQPNDEQHPVAMKIDTKSSDNGKQPTVFNVENDMGEQPNDAMINDTNVSHNGKQTTVSNAENDLGECPNDEQPDAVKNDINKKGDSSNVENHNTDETVGSGKIKEGTAVCNIDMFSCSECDHCAATEMEIMKHRLQHSIRSKVKCSICSFSGTKKSVVSHEAEDHSKPRMVIVSTEPKTIISESSVIETEKNIYKPKPTSSFKCSDCNFCATYSLALEKHKLHHKLPSAYKCRWCSYSASLMSTRSHENKLHEKEILSIGECKESIAPDMETPEKYFDSVQKRFVCPHCGACLESSPSLRSHLSSHKQKPKYQILSCDVCDFKTNVKQKLKEHNDLEHYSMLKRCDECDYATLLQHEFELHKTRHSSVSKVTCSKCSYSSSKSKVYVHELQDHEVSMKPGSWRYYMQSCKRYECPLCQFFSNSHHTFQKHLTGHERSLKYKCELCSYSSSSSNVIENHKHYHLNKGPMTTTMSTTHAKYKCDKCEYSAPTIKSFHVHKKCHDEGNGKFKCNECTYSSVFSEYVIRHIQMHHKSMANQALMDHSYIASKVVNKKRKDSTLQSLNQNTNITAQGVSSDILAVESYTGASLSAENDQTGAVSTAIITQVDNDNIVQEIDKLKANSTID
ncbi:unnamed protein product, partial [Owenia fusiformis]